MRRTESIVDLARTESVHASAALMAPAQFILSFLPTSPPFLTEDYHLCYVDQTKTKRTREPQSCFP